MRVLDLRSIPEPITVLVCPLRLFIVKLQLRHSQFRQAVQLPCFRDAVVISVLPETKACEDRVFVINDSIAVASVLRLVVLGKRKKTVATDAQRWLWLRREVAEEFRSTINRPIAITVKCKPCIIGSYCCPCSLFSNGIIVDIKVNAALWIG